MMKKIQNIKLAVDAVVFGYKNTRLEVLLIQQKYGETKGEWALPGGFVLENEDLEKAVLRELKEETGVEVSYMEQLYTFGNINRDPRGRVVSVAYIVMIDHALHNLQANSDAQDVQWYPINSLPQLAYDHSEIVTLALLRLQNKIKYAPIGFELLDKSFPFSDLENLYQTILNRKIDRRNFRKKILSFGFVVETNEIRQIGSGRPAKLFKFDHHKYTELEKQGIHFEIKFA